MEKGLEPFSSLFLTDFAQASMATLARGMGASMKVTTKSFSNSTTPMERGLTAMA